MSEANDFLVDGIYTFEIGGKRKKVLTNRRDTGRFYRCG